jgi:hypothetical protein
MHESYYTTKLLHEDRQRDLMRHIEQRNLRRIALDMVQGQAVSPRARIVAIVKAFISRFEYQRVESLSTAELRALKQD